MSRGVATSARARRPASASIAGADLLALAAAKPRPRRTPAPPRNRGVLREVIDTLDGTVQGVVERGRRGSLDDRDPAFIESQLRWLQPLADIYFRGEVRDIERIPARGPVLVVGNHSGGLATPDTWVFMVNFLRHFGTQRGAYALAHNVVMGLPLAGRWLRKVGTLPAHPDAARDALRRRAAVLVYPGGDEDVFRPWSERNRIRLAGRTGFIRLALQERVPVQPVVSIGGHETVFVASDGRRLARTLGLERFRLKALPLVIAPPWGISPGDLLLHVPLPAKITVQVGEPIDFHAQFGALDARDPEVLWACYHYVERRMQTILDTLAAERRLPLLG
ncbi:MAG: 1-acyl-sn-glycerol-3-phosphate acyltransferase [Candidatus Dormibacteraeota bacterium]|uniref:1-acyl-sn-glycerol-3-phosphate acyltransferase n=1 Tax=Candidatus Amunia macphersoniae TaxID=3127014 RepID=A0A934KML0_9BACT|nr:1-acyl-sn-glycerol-3-phosphate acyltransferase [Candidatus Dormibacteraeota bacterium]